MLSQELQTPAQMTVWSEGSFSTARQKLNLAANDDGDIVTDAHRRLPDHMIVAADSAPIAPISLPVEQGYTSFQTAQTEQVENADANVIQADVDHHVAEQHENTSTHHDEQFQQHQALQDQQQVTQENEQEQQREHQEQQEQQEQQQEPQEQQQQQPPQHDHQQGQVQEHRQERQQHEERMHDAQQPEQQPLRAEQSLQQQQFVQAVVAGSSEGAQREAPRKRSGSNRRKRYRCGYCHELGHNQKTCPLRPPHLPTSTSRSQAHRTVMLDAAQLQHAAAKVGEELSRMFFEMTSAHSDDEWQPPQQISYDAVLEAANKEVLQANQSVADSKTDQEFDNALDHLQVAVGTMEKVAVLIYKSAVLAHTMNRNIEDPS